MEAGRTVIQMAGGEIASSICPLFWQHGETAEELREEIARMQEGGIGGFIVESRPHPDYLSYGWWRDLDVIIEEADRRGMDVWIFDDSAYPSGLGGGKVKTLYPEAVKRYLSLRQIDALGPMSGTLLQVGAWLSEGEELLGVVAVKREGGREAVIEDTLTDLTGLVEDGMLYWDIPEGSWRIFLLVVTGKGGEEWTKDYVNPISYEAVGRYIEIVYEEHYKRYRDRFGGTIKGFFVDEPRFGNASSYENTPGDAACVYPWSSEAREELRLQWGEDYLCYLPFLWNRENKVCRDIQYTYMDVVSRLFARDFLGQIREWCNRHSVKVIGHVVEDNGAHARLGFGPGHFFRSMEGFDTSGIDIVYQIWPERKEGYHTTPFGYLNAEFFYWGLGKMASSAAHIDPAKEGLTICEIFGAYGWQEGLKLMKWLTDHACVRGINVLVPHAFSPKYPDTDCPPHFYAKGYNPQWKYFRKWSDYANRVCHLLRGGTHRATVAVLYHAEMEWGGAYMPFEKVVRVLMEAQIDCDVLPADCLAGLGAGRDSESGKGTVNSRIGQKNEGCTAAGISCGRAADGRLWVGEESYEVLFVPGAACLPGSLARALESLAASGVPVVFVDRYPEHIYREKEESSIETLQWGDKIEQISLSQIADWMKKRGFVDVQVQESCPDLRCLHYEREGQHIYFFTNESIYRTVDTSVTLQGLGGQSGTGKSGAEGEQAEKGEMVFYDAMEDAFYRIPGWRREVSDSGTAREIFDLTLAPCQSVFVVSCPDVEVAEGSAAGVSGICESLRTGGLGHAADELRQRLPVITGRNFKADSREPLEGEWKISICTPGGAWESLPLRELANISARELLPAYSGTICYETAFELDAVQASSRILLDLGEVYEISDLELNGERAGVRICPPYTYELTGREGINELKILVTNTFAKEKGANLFDRAMPQEPSGLLGPVCLYFSRNSFGEQ